MQFEGFLITHATRSSSCGSWSHKQATFESLHVCRVLGTQGTINVGIGRHICWRSACAAHVWEIKEMQKCCLFPLVGPWCHSISMHCSCIPSSSIRMPSACSFNLFSQSLPCETMVGCQPEAGWRALSNMSCNEKESLALEANILLSCTSLIKLF